MLAAPRLPRRWLLIRQGAIGDTILLSSVIQAIRARIPTSWIEVMGIQERVELLVGEGLADRALSVERFPLESLHQKDAHLPPPLADLFSRFDIIVYYTAAVYPWLADRMRVKADLEVRIYPALPPVGYARHAVCFYLDPLQDFLDIQTPPKPRLVLSPDELDSAKLYYLTQSLDPSQVFILGMHVGAGSPRKQASLTFFESVARYFLHRQSMALLLTQGPADESPVRQLLHRLPPNHTVLVVNNRPLRELAAILSHASLFIGNDSGITHMAAAVGCPTLAVFTAGDPVLWRPLGNHSSIVEWKQPPFCDAGLTQEFFHLFFSSSLEIN